MKSLVLLLGSITAFLAWSGAQLKRSVTQEFPTTKEAA